VSDRIWYLGAAGKVVGPMTVERVHERLATGVPRRTKAWREGMDGWTPLGEIVELRPAGATDEAEIAPAAPEGGEPAVELAPDPASEGAAGDRAPEPASIEAGAGGPSASPSPSGLEAGASADGAGAAPRRSRSGTGKRGRPSSSASRAVLSGATPATLARAPGGAARAPRPDRPSLATRLRALLAAPPPPPQRIEPVDPWHAFALGHDRSRIAVAALTVLASAVPLGGLVGATAQSYQSRERLLGRPVPGVRASFGFAARRAGASIAVPLGLAAAAAAPLLALALLGLLTKVPYAGPIGAGALFVVEIALGAATLALLVASALACALAPVVVAFEETGARGTAQVLADLARRSAARIVARGAAPALALVAYGLGALVAAALSIALPLAVTRLAIGPEALAGGPDEVAGLGIGLAAAAAWSALALVTAAGVVASVGNALASTLYLAGRAADDDPPGRDAAPAVEPAAATS
jgi:hypothetical protein